jgi:hypothetical protein
MPQDAQIAYIGLLYLGFLLTAIVYLATIIRLDGPTGDKSSIAGDKLLFENTPTKEQLYITGPNRERPHSQIFSGKPPRRNIRA